MRMLMPQAHRYHLIASFSSFSYSSPLCDYRDPLTRPLGRRQYSARIREDVLSLAGSKEIVGAGPIIRTIRPIFSGSV